MGFKQAKEKVLQALASGAYQHEVRRNISEKNKLQTGEVTASFVASLVQRCTGHDHSCKPHHQCAELEVHVLRKAGWYIKFYFVDPETVFISVHQ